MDKSKWEGSSLKAPSTLQTKQPGYPSLRTPSAQALIAMVQSLPATCPPACPEGTRRTTQVAMLLRSMCLICPWSLPSNATAGGKGTLPRWSRGTTGRQLQCTFWPPCWSPSLLPVGEANPPLLGFSPCFALLSHEFYQPAQFPLNIPASLLS